MNARWLLALAGLAALGWVASRPVAAWGHDLDGALAGAVPVVVVVADPGRPLAAELEQSVDQAWRELRPRALRVLLERGDPRLGASTALAVCVLTPQARRVARRDGAMSPPVAREWLARALDLAASVEAREERARADPREAFALARLAMELGDTEGAEAGFQTLAESHDPDLRAGAWARLARISLERGDLAEARVRLGRGASPSPEAGGTLELARGMVHLAARENRAACEALDRAVALLGSDPDLDRAQLELARALSAAGEDSRAIATLEALAKSAASVELRETARRLADALHVPSPASH